MIHLDIRTTTVDAHRVSVSTIYCRPGIENRLPFTASNNVTISTDAVGETKVGQVGGRKIIVLLRNNRCDPERWHKPAIALVNDSRAAAKAIKDAVREFRASLNHQPKVLA